MDTDIILAARKHDRVPKACALPEGERRRTRSQLPFRVNRVVFAVPALCPVIGQSRTCKSGVEGILATPYESTPLPDANNRFVGSARLFNHSTREASSQGSMMTRWLASP